MSNIPRPLARRIDRLARRAHAFHRWSHHPLCDRYAGEVVRLGRRTRLCRGCALSALGAVVGVASGLAAPAAPGAAWLAGALALAAAVPLAVPRRAAGVEAGAPGGRAPKLATRFLPFALAGAAAAQALAAPSPARLAAAALALAAIAAGLVRYRRRGPNRGACAGCPEAPAGVHCAGFREIARRERAFSRRASRWIAAARAPGGLAVPARE